MRKILFIVIIFWNDLSFAQTNVYHPISDDGVWNVFMHYDCFSGGSCEDYFSYIIAKDTSINSKTYKKVIISGINSIIDIDCYYLPPSPDLAYIREDTTAKIVYQLNDWDTTHSERILFDYNLTVGDSFGSVLISSIDSILIGSSYRKKWNVSGCINGCIGAFIQGIGTYNGLLQYVCDPCSPHSMMYWLNCYTENGVVLYAFDTTQCQLIDVNPGITKQSQEFSLYPNPVLKSNPIKISCNDNSYSTIRILIFNLLGEEIYSRQINLDEPFEIGDIPPAIYLYQLHTKSGELLDRGKLDVF